MLSTSPFLSAFFVLYLLLIQEVDVTLPYRFQSASISFFLEDSSWLTSELLSFDSSL